MASKPWHEVRENLDHKCPLETSLLTWQALYRGDKDATFKDYTTFIQKHPTWPWLHVIKKNAEKVADGFYVKSWFKTHPPQTEAGTKAYIKTIKDIKLLKTVWAHNSMDQTTEKALYHRLKTSLSITEVASRVHYYLDKGDTHRAQKIIEYIPKPFQAIARARLAFLNEKPQKNFPQDSRVILDALGYYMKQKEKGYDKAYDLLKKHKQKLYKLNAHKTWKQIHILIRCAFEAGDYNRAFNLLKDYKGLTKGDYVDALWLDGWLHATHKKFKEAISLFESLYRYAVTPISRSKAAFWIGQTHEQKGNKKQAILWFKKAAVYVTTFYGQEALMKLNKPLSLRYVKPSLKDKRAFQRNTLVKAALCLLDTPLMPEFKTFLYMALRQAKTQGESLLILDLAQKHIPYEVVSLTKSVPAYTTNDYGYPVLPKKLWSHMKQENIQTALGHAVIRKESGFNPKLVSKAGALGLMQVMPMTAKMLAKKKNIPFIQENLTQDMAYNIRLGCAYLNKSLHKYQDFLPLALAAYNAGPRNADKWIQLFGDPRTDKVNTLTWIEILPFGETRNYIHRVTEAMRVYAYLEKLKSYT